MRGPIRLAALTALGIAWLGAARAEPPVQVRILVAATKGRIIPQSKGGGGFERGFRFTATPGKSSHWIRQVLEVRGTVFDAKGGSKAAHLDVIEYYRVDSAGRTKRDSHYSQYWDYCGGTLTISSTLTYGRLLPKKRGDTIVGKSFILRSAKDATGKYVTMKTRTLPRRTIPAERGERVEFESDAGSPQTRYTYRVRWNACPGSGPRTRPSGTIDVGTYTIEAPAQTGPTVAAARPRPIPRIKKRH